MKRFLLHSLSIATIVALAIISLLSIEGISTSSVSSLINYSFSKIPEGNRTITVTSNNIVPTQQELDSTSADLNTYFSALLASGLSREILYHETADDHGVGFYYGGVDALSKHVSILQGRLPNSCSPKLCEVIQVGGQRAETPQTVPFGINVVGRATLADHKLFSGTFAPDDNVPLYLADGVVRATSLQSFSNLQGANGWVGEINRQLIEKLGLSHYIDSVIRAENQIAVNQPGLGLTWPQDSLAEALSSGNALKTKFDLLAYSIGAFLTILLALFSFRKREEHFQFRSGLSRIGTPKKVLVQELLIEQGAPILLGILLGIALSPLVPVLLSAAHFDGSHIYEGQLGNALIFLIAFFISAGITMYSDKSWRRWAFALFTLALFVNLYYFALRNANSGKNWFFPLLAILLPLWMSHVILPRLSSLPRKRGPTTFIFLRENILMWQGLAALLSLTTVLGVMTLSFDSGISKRIDFQAENRVPLDVRVDTGSSLVRPFDIASLSNFESLTPGSRAFAILRSGTTIRTQSAISDSLVVLGMTPETLSRLDSPSQRKLAKIILPAHSTNEPGIDIGRAKRALVAELKNVPKEVDLLSWFRTPRGNHSSFKFEGHGNFRKLTLDGAVPPGSLLTAFELRETSQYLSRRLHAIGEGKFSVPMLKGTGGISSVSLDGQRIDFSHPDWGIKKFKYAFDGESLYLRPKWNIELPRVVVDPTTAALGTNGILTLSSEGDSSFQARVGAVIEHFPTAGNRFVIMDLNQLQAEFSRSSPGSSDPIEVWVATPDEPNYLDNLRHSIFTSLSYTGKSNVKERLRQNPINIGLNASYKVSLLYFLLVSLFMLALALPLLRKDGSKILNQLEINGAGPRLLRAAMRSSLRLTLIAGILVGLAFGAIIAHYYISESIPFVTIGITLSLALVLSEIGTKLVTRRFFREEAMMDNS